MKIQNLIKSTFVLILLFSLALSAVANDQEDLAEKLAENYDPILAIQFYQDISNIGVKPEVDAKYFGDKNNIGKNPQADDKFFSGTYKDDAKSFSRQNFNKHKDSAQVYLTKKFAAPYQVTEVSADFF